MSRTGFHRRWGGDGRRTAFWWGIFACYIRVPKFFFAQLTAPRIPIFIFRVYAWGCLYIWLDPRALKLSYNLSHHPFPRPVAVELNWIGMNFNAVRAQCLMEHVVRRLLNYFRKFIYVAVSVWLTVLIKLSDILPLRIRAYPSHIYIEDYITPFYRFPPNANSFSSTYYCRCVFNWACMISCKQTAFSPADLISLECKRRHHRKCIDQVRCQTPQDIIIGICFDVVACVAFV